MSGRYYIDTNALIKYSCYQDYLTDPEYGVREIRELINHKQGKFFFSLNIVGILSSFIKVLSL